MDARLLFPSLYISAADLQGKDVRLHIASVSVDKLKTSKGTEKKPTVYFREMEAKHRAGKGENKRMILNKTNMKAIAKMYGFETDDWIDKPITLYPTRCEAFGETVDCIRVREE